MQKRSLLWRYYPDWKVTRKRCGKSLSKTTWLMSAKLSGSRAKDKVHWLLQGKLVDGKLKSGKENGSARLHLPLYNAENTSLLVNNYIIRREPVV